MSERRHLGRWAALALLGGAWGFAALSLWSYSPADWPGHAAWPPPDRAHNWCGSVGAWCAHQMVRTVGGGAWALWGVASVFLAVKLSGGRLGDRWLRVVGLALLAVTVGAMLAWVRGGTGTGLPEGSGGVVGQWAVGLLKARFGQAGTALVLSISFVLSLLLAADELVIRFLRAGVGASVGTAKLVKSAQPKMRFRFPELPTLPALPKFVTRDAAESAEKVKHLPAPKKAAVIPVVEPVLDDEAKKAPVLLKSARKLKEFQAEVAVSVPEETEEDEDEIEAEDVVAVEPEVEDEPEPAEPAAPPKPAMIVRVPSAAKPVRTAPPPPKELGDYTLPGWDCLEDAEHNYAATQEAYVREKAAVLEATMQEFGVDAHVVEIDTGPVITMYELALAKGIKVSAISSLTNDIARTLAATSVRIVAPIPGKSTVGIEVPNAQKEKVRMKELMQLAPEATAKMGIPIYLGKDGSGEPLISDLTAMPHCLIAGTTGSGKSVCINTIIMSVLYTQRPDAVKLILVDPKVVEMAPFKDVPHLMCPVITETAKAAGVLEWACTKMDERYALLAEAGVRNLKSYNALTREELLERFAPETPEEEAKIPKKLPFIVIVIDELADLMMTGGKDVEGHIVRIAQKARAVGIHLVLATQRPQATVVTGLIKANMPTKIAFRVGSRTDSRIVLDQNGAEVLLGQGDMLFLPPGASKPLRGQGTYIDDHEIRDSVKLVKGLAEAQYEPELVQIKAPGLGESAERDELFDDAVRVVLESKRGSVSLLQRKLTIGYGRASRLIEQMAEAGLVGDYKGSQAREATITLEEWDAMKAQQQQDEEAGMTV